MASWKNSYSFHFLHFVTGWFVGLYGSKLWMKLTILSVSIILPFIEFLINKVKAKNNKTFLLPTHTSHFQSNLWNLVFTYLPIIVSKTFNKKQKADDIDGVFIVGPFGNPSGGERFNYNGYDGVTELIVHSGTVVDSIAFLFTKDGRNEFQRFGGEGGHSIEVYLEIDEQITEVQGSYGTWYGSNVIIQITFWSSKGRKFGPYGTNPNDGRGGQKMLLGQFHEKGGKLVGFFGERSDYFISSIGFYFQE